MESLPRVLVYEVCDYLWPKELNEGLSRTNKDLRAIVFSFIQEIEPYRTRFLGPLSFHPPVACLFPLLYSATVTPLGVLRMGATYTNGGVFINSLRFWAQNVFEYTGSVYTSNNITENVTVGGCFLGGFQQETEFRDRMHEDLFGLMEPGSTWSIPQKYKENYLPCASFLTQTPCKKGADYSEEDYSRWGREIGPILRTGEIQLQSENVFLDTMQCADAFGLVNVVGVARPGFATCPVRTVLICTYLQTRTPDLRRYHNLTDLTEVTSNLLPPVCTRVQSSHYSYVSFDVTEGPLLWLQYTSYETSQVEIPVPPRLFRHAEILLIDIDDRRDDFHTEEKGMDIAFVLFGGREISHHLVGN